MTAPTRAWRLTLECGHILLGATRNDDPEEHMPGDIIYCQLCPTITRGNYEEFWRRTVVNAELIDQYRRPERRTVEGWLADKSLSRRDRP